MLIKQKNLLPKVDSIATLLTPTAEKVNALLNGDKQVATAKLTDNVAQQMVTGNRVAESELHNTLPTSSSFASQGVTGHAHSSTQPQMQFSPMATQVLNAQVGTPEWQQQLNQQIVMFSRNGLQKAELRLHPEELGSLHIRMKIEDGQAQLHLASQSGQVRSVLENAMHQLRQALSENGSSSRKVRCLATLMTVGNNKICQIPLNLVEMVPIIIKEARVIQCN